MSSISSQQHQDYLILTHNIELLNTISQTNKMASKIKETGIDTTDFNDLYDNSFNFKEIKRKYINNLISYSFLKKISSLYQWPIGCIGNLIDNSIFHGKSNIIKIDVKCYNKEVFQILHLADKDIDISKITKPNSNLSFYSDFNNKKIVLSIIDNGIGISSEIFNKMMFSFGDKSEKNLNNTLHNYYNFGITLKSSCMRLSDSLLIISKTKNEFSIGLISNSMQMKINNDLIVTPIVNYIHKDNIFEFKSQYALQSLNLILNEVRFLFWNEEELFSYIKTFQTGTHIFLFDFKQFSPKKENLGNLNNFELLFDYNEKDILYNIFYIFNNNRDLIDVSLKKYIQNLYLNNNCNIYIFDELIDLKNSDINQLRNFHDSYKENKNEIKDDKIEIINTNFSIQCDKKNEIKCLIFDNELYNGILIKKNEETFMNEILKKKYNIKFSTIEQNEILLFLKGRLISRLNQKKLGDLSYFEKNKNKKENQLKKNYTNNWFGYIELPDNSLYETVSTKTEFKDKILFSYFYSKLFNLLKKIQE